MELKNLDKALGKSVTMILDKLNKVIDVFKNESKKNSDNVKGLEILVKSVSNEILKLHNQDYSDRFKVIEEKISGKNFISEKDDIIKEVRSIIESIKGIELKTEVKTEKIDTSKIELLLEKISQKNISLPDFEFKDINGNKYLKVYVDRTGSGLNTVHLFNVRGNTINPASEETLSEIEANQTNGTQKTLVLNGIGTQVNPATEEKQDPTAPYAISDLDESGTTKYYGFLKDDGGWYIMSVTGTAVRYVKGASGYSFASPSSLTYDTFSNTF